MPTYANANAVALVYLAEGTFNATPTGPVGGYKTMRITKESLDDTPKFVTSSEIVSNRTQKDQYFVGNSAKGNISFELSPTGPTDDFLAAAASNTWSTNTLAFPGTTQPSFSIEKQFTDVAQYQLFTGMSLDSMSLDLSSQKIVTGDLTFMGVKSYLNGTTSATAPTAATSTPAFTASANVASILLNGLALPAKVESLSLSIKNNLAEREAVGTPDSDVFGRGYLEVAGSMNAYFGGNSYFNLMKNNSSAALAFSISNGTNRYDFNIPNAKFQSDHIETPGANQTIKENIAFKAFAPTGGSLMTIVRV